MTLEQISDVSQAVVAVAVDLSLVDLILETRQNTKMMRAAAVLDSQMSFVSINETPAKDGPLSDLAFRVLTAHESLTPYGRRHLCHRYMRAVFQRVEVQFALYRSGVLDAEVWALRRSYTKSLLLNPLIAEISRLEKSNSMLTAFTAELEATPADAPAVCMGSDQSNAAKSGEAAS